MAINTRRDYTLEADQSSSPSTVTPTRQHHNPIPDFTSPSAYLNHEAYSHTAPNTPHGLTSHHHGTYDLHSTASGISPTMDEHFAFTYGDFSAENGYLPFVPLDHSTPSASRIEDDRTPIILDTQHIIQPHSLPAPPNLHNDDTVRASRSQRPLMSPFRTFESPPGMMGYPGPSQQFIDPSVAYHPLPKTYMYPNTSPQDMFQYVNMQPPQIYPQPGQYYTQGPPQYARRNGSPTGSVASSVASLARSGSTSSELRQARPKVKLTFDDKHNIVELHRANSSLRQEDIARQYGVDRSTISKIILSAHRWMKPQEVQMPALPKPLKAVGGRFPAIEAMMHDWMDQQIASGLDVRDNVARDKAKAFAREIGFPMERFKASAKWLDKFKDRRKAAGKPTTSPMHVAFGYYPYPKQNAVYPMMSSIDNSVMLSRSQSVATFSSSSSSGQEMYQQSPDFMPMDTPNRIGLTKSEPDLVHLDMTPGSRKRSQSSPQLLVEPGMQLPSSGKASRLVRPTPLNLHRQNSYHGTSPSPRRSTQLARANSSQGGIRRSRPTSLAASAFGITPIIGEAYSPLGSPATSASSGTHSRQRSDTSLAPFTSSMSGMTISPDMSESSESGAGHMTMTVPPLTPITPAHAMANGVFPNFDYGDIQSEVGHYATMPNKHYGQYVQPHHAYAPQDFGPAYGASRPDPHGSWQ